MKLLCKLLVVTGVFIFCAFSISLQSAHAQALEFEVLSRNGRGIPHVEIRPEVIIGSREELIRDGANRKLGKRVVSVISRDGGRNWRDAGEIVALEDEDVDLGDGSMLVTQSGKIFYAFRYNLYRGRYAQRPYYSIRVSQSDDDGISWKEHSIVHESRPPADVKAGLWTPVLVKLPDGSLQCYYDDGHLPELEYTHRRNAGQWAAMRTFDPNSETWVRPVIVSRPPKSVSNNLRFVAEGARTPLLLGDNHLWSPVESVVLDLPPHRTRSLILRFAESKDGGATWSWQNEQWPILGWLPPLHRSGLYFDWSWPLAALADQKTAVIVFRSNDIHGDNSIDRNEKASHESHLSTGIEPSHGTAHRVDKHLDYFLRLNDGASWAKGTVTLDAITDHNILSLSGGGVMIGYRPKATPRRFVVIKGVLVN